MTLTDRHLALGKEAQNFICDGYHLMNGSYTAHQVRWDVMRLLDEEPHGFVSAWRLDVDKYHAHLLSPLGMVLADERFGVDDLATQVLIDWVAEVLNLENGE